MTAVSFRDTIRESMDCESCRKHGQQKDRGCYLEGYRRETPFQVTKEHELYGRVWHCPRSCSIAVSGWYGEFSRYEKGILPCAGGWSNQPNLYVEAITVLANAIDARNAEDIEETKRKATKARKG